MLLTERMKEDIFSQAEQSIIQYLFRVERSLFRRSRILQPTL